MQGQPFHNRPRCIRDDCARRQWRKDPGLCQHHARLAGLYPLLPQCAAEGCPRKARTTGEGSRCRKHGGALSEGEKPQPALPPVCTAIYCGLNAKKDGLCGKHLQAQGNLPGRRRCVTEDCINQQSRQAGLCERCYRRRAELLNVCGHPLCGRRTVGEYCQLHNVGLDFTAGDWFDWVAAERLFDGRLKDRKPTVPELKWVLARAEQKDMSLLDLAPQMGMDYNRLRAWRQQVIRLEAAA